MEFYIVLIILAFVFIIITTLIHYIIGKKIVTIASGIICSIILLVMGLYNAYHKKLTTSYVSQNNVKVDTRDNKMFFRFGSMSKAVNFCNKTNDCRYVIPSKTSFYVSSSNNISSCKNANTKDGIWCAIDNKTYTTVENSPCYDKGVLTNCRGKGCPYETCDELFSSVQNCNACLDSKKIWCDGKCVEKSESSQCVNESLITDCNQIISSYGDVTFVPDNSGVRIYGKTCTPPSDVKGYGLCSPSEIMNTSPLFLNDGDPSSPKNICTNLKECSGYVCQGNQCTYLTPTTKPQCCNIHDIPFCGQTQYMCKGSGCNVFTGCV